MPPRGHPRSTRHHHPVDAGRVRIHLPHSPLHGLLDGETVSVNADGMGPRKEAPRAKALFERCT